MKKLKNQSQGITLIALVITIIVLLLLAGVAIATLTGENGVISKAQQATINSENGEVYETLKLKLVDNNITNQTGETNMSKLDYLLSNSYIDSNNIVDVEHLTGKNMKTGNGSLDTGDVYYIKEIEENEYDLVYVNDRKEETNLGNLFESIKPVGLEFLEITQEGELSLKEEYSYYGTGTDTGKIDLITEIRIPEYIDGIRVTKIATNAFSNCKNLESITLPNSVTQISRWAFYKCEKLENINIPENVTVIEGEAFYKCLKLDDIKIPQGCTTLFYGTFMSCISLTEITLPTNIEKIGEKVFAGCDKLKTVNYEGTMIQWNAINIYDDTLTNVTIRCSDGDI